MFRLCLPILSLAAYLSAAEFPEAAFSNGNLRLKVYLPDAKEGFYRATRFDWSGMIALIPFDSWMNSAYFLFPSSLVITYLAAWLIGAIICWLKLDRLGLRLCAAYLCVAVLATGLAFYGSSDSVTLFLWAVYPLTFLLGRLGLHVSDSWINNAGLSVPLNLLIVHVAGWAISWSRRRASS